MQLIPDEPALAAALAHHARASRRLRFEVASLVGNPALAREVEAAVAERPGVVRAAASWRSGRVLIEYAPDAPVLEELEHLARRARAAPARRAGRRALARE